MSHKGTVYKVKPGTVIVMTGNFEFKEVKNKVPVAVGREITFTDRDIVHPARNRFPLAAVACLLVFMLISGVMLYRDPVPEVYAHVGMEAHSSKASSSVEFALDKNLEVIDVKTGSKETEDIIRATSLEGLPVSEAVQAVIESCSGDGENSSDDEARVVMSATVNDDGGTGEVEGEDRLEKELLSGASGELEEKQQEGEVYVFRLSPEKRKQALQKGVAPGRYALWEEMKKNNAGLDLEQVTTKNINEIIREHKQVKESMAKNAAKWKDTSSRGGKKPEKPGEKGPPDFVQGSSTEQEELSPSSSKQEPQPGGKKDTPSRKSNEKKSLSDKKKNNPPGAKDIKAKEAKGKGKNKEINNQKNGPEKDKKINGPASAPGKGRMQPGKGFEFIPGKIKDKYLKKQGPPGDKPKDKKHNNKAKPFQKGKN